MQEIKDMVCPFCGCLCDDITLEVENDKIVSANNCCTIGNAKFLGGKNRLKTPIKKVDGAWVEISYDEAVETAVDMLLDATGRCSLAGPGRTERRSVSGPYERNSGRRH